MAIIKAFVFCCLIATIYAGDYSRGHSGYSDMKTYGGGSGYGSGSGYGTYGSGSGSYQPYHGSYGSGKGDYKPSHGDYKPSHGDYKPSHGGYSQGGYMSHGSGKYSGMDTGYGYHRSY